MKISIGSNFWRVLEPILLGSTANIIINIVFNPSNPSGWWSKTEFVVAILFCVPITELNRVVERRLMKKYSGLNSYKLFAYQLLILSFLLLLLLNGVGRIYHWLIYDDFYEWGEIFIINLIVFLVSFFLVTFKWSVRFYNQLKLTEDHLDKSTQEVHKLSSKLNHSNQTINLKKIDGDYKVNVSDIRIAFIEYGNVKVYDQENTFYTYQGSLTDLANLLPENLFFLATRNIIVHRKTIKSISSLPYGKIQLQIEGFETTISEATVSRPKASSFRKWYHIT